MLPTSPSCPINCPGSRPPQTVEQFGRFPFKKCCTPPGTPCKPHTWTALAPFWQLLCHAPVPFPGTFLQPVKYQNGTGLLGYREILSQGQPALPYPCQWQSTLSFLCWKVPEKHEGTVRIWPCPPLPSVKDWHSVSFTIKDHYGQERVQIMVYFVRCVHNEAFRKSIQHCSHWPCHECSEQKNTSVIFAHLFILAISDDLLQDLLAALWVFPSVGFPYIHPRHSAVDILREDCSTMSILQNLGNWFSLR